MKSRLLHGVIRQHRNFALRSFRWGFGLVLIAFLLGPAAVGQMIPDVTVVKAEPTGETGPRANITVTFSAVMVPADSLDRDLEDPPVKFNPEIPGVARWIMGNVLRFYPDGPLNPATRYEATVTSDRTYLSGVRLRESYSFSFNTADLRVLDANWTARPEKQQQRRMRLFINLRFNYAVDPGELKKRLSIDGIENAATSRLQWNIAGPGAGPSSIRRKERFTPANQSLARRDFTIVSAPIERTERRQRYSLIVREGLPCINCGETMPHEYRRDVYIEAVGRLIIQNVSARSQPEQSVIQINCSRFVDATDIEKYIKVEPEADYRVEVSYSSIYIKGDFKPGDEYVVTVLPGLGSSTEAELEQEYSTTVRIPDISPTLTFNTQGIYLPLEGARLLELSTINIDKVRIEVERIFPNNLVFALTSGAVSTGRYGRGSVAHVGRRFFEKEFVLRSERNNKLISTIDFGTIVGDTARGLFKVVARSTDRSWQFDSRIVMLTNLGVTARMADDYLMVWVNSLSDGDAVGKAVVRLYSLNNQLLLEGNTDSRGIAVFTDIGDKTEGFDPYLIAVSKDADLSFLRFSDTRLPTADFDVTGRPLLTSGYETFLYTERGVYRPDDTVRLVSMVRGAAGKMPEEFPYFLTIKDPTGREFKSLRVRTSDRGIESVDIEIPDFAGTGKYSVQAHIGDDYVIGRTTFQVEEFMPDKIKVELTTPKTVYSTGDTLQITVKGTYLFGPPAKQHMVSGEVMVEPYTFQPSGYSGYSFANPDRKFTTDRRSLPERSLDDSGLVTYAQVISNNYRPPSALKGLLSAVVSEQGGRAVAAYGEVVIHAYSRYVGISTDVKGYAKPGEEISVNLVALTPEGERTTVDSTRVRFYRVIYHSILKKDANGYYRYVSEAKDEPLDSMTLSIASQGASVPFTPADHGRYKVVVEDLDGGHAAATSFYASGWGYAPWAMDQPDRIEIDLDKDAYIEGETAHIQVRAPFGGKLLMTVEKDRVLEFITAEMDENTAEFNISVKTDYFPNVYVTAAVIKDARDVDKVTPARAFGVAPLVVSSNERRIKVDIDGPEVIESNSTLNLTVNTGTSGTAHLAVSAVDAGILSLTDYQTPEPFEFFYGKKQLYLQPYDIYSWIYPDIGRAASHLSPAGGRNLFADRRKRHLNPITARRVKPVALWSGIVNTDDTGMVKISFDVGQFNGKLVVTAVAVQEERVGAATTDIFVRDPIVLQESFPRFLSPNDEFEGLATVFNNKKETRPVDVSLSIGGPADILSASSQTVQLPSGSEGHAEFRTRAALQPGKISCELLATDGVDSTRLSFELPNRPSQGLTTRFGSGALAASDTVMVALPAGWIEGTDEYVLQTSSLAGVQFARQIDYLLRYPYGCLEQTTSQLFPLLYFNGLAKFADPSLLKANAAGYYINEGILKLTQLMRSDGSFSFWPGGSRVHHWSSVYAGHFLLEAKAAGYTVPPEVERTVALHLRDIALGRVSETTVAERVYAAYALSVTNRMERRIANYLKELHPDDIPVYSRYQIAGALFRFGEEQAALELIPTDIQPAIFEPETGGTFNSDVRTNAILLEVLTQVQPNHPSTAVLAKSLVESAGKGRWYSTQATAFALMALGKYFAGQEVAEAHGSVQIENDTTYTVGKEDTRVTRRDLAGRAARIINDGPGTMFYYWQASGVSSLPAAEEYERGIELQRIYLDVNGDELDLDSVVLGAQIICRIEAKASDRQLSNVVINDLLPAGMEIENPRLKTTPRLSWLPKSTMRTEYQDIRDDRLLLFTDLSPKRNAIFYYSLRVTVKGEFKIPPVMAECMYNPTIAASASSGVLKVIDRTGN